MRIVILALLMVACIGATWAAEPESALPNPRIVNAIDGVLAAFDRYQVVAIGEQHGIQQVGDFYQSLLRDRRFAKTVDAIVLEYGNARFQDLADQYVNGQPVPFTSLRRIWSDAIAKVPGGTELMYVQIFTTVRYLNSLVPPGGKRLRLLLGDPAVDWTLINYQSDAVPYQLSREEHFANVVIQQALRKNLRALVIMGGPHLARGSSGLEKVVAQDGRSASGVAPVPQGMQQIVESAYPGKTYVVLIHTGFVDDTVNTAIESRMSDWKVPALATVRGSWLEGIRASKFPEAIMISPDGPTKMGSRADSVQTLSLGGPGPDQWALPIPKPGSVSIPALIPGADAYLYLGKRDDLTMSPFEPSVYLDLDYFREINRRHLIMFGTEQNWAQVARDHPHRYVDNFK